VPSSQSRKGKLPKPISHKIKDAKSKPKKYSFCENERIIIG
jgi:hypothetical protein